MSTPTLAYLACYSVTRYGRCGWVTAYRTDEPNGASRAISALDAMRRSRDGSEGLVGYVGHDCMLDAVRDASAWEHERNVGAR